MHKFYSRVKSIGATSSVYMMSSFIGRGLPFFLLPVLTRYLSTDDYGFIAMFNIIRSFLLPLIAISTAGAIGRAYFDRDKAGFNFSSYISSAFFVNTVFFLIFGVILFFLKDFISTRIGLPWQWVLAVPFFGYAASLISVREKLWVFEDKPFRYAVFFVSKLTINIALSLLLVIVFSMSWEGRIVGIIATEILFAVAAIILLVRKYRVKISVQINYIKDILKFGLPLLPHAVAMAILTGADKFFLKKAEGFSVLGVYIIGFMFGQIVLFISSSIDVAISPRLYRRLGALNKENSLELVRYIYVYLLILIFIASAVAFSSRFLLKFLVAEEFYPAGKFIIWICFANVSFGMYRVFAQFITYAKKTYMLSYATVVSSVFAVFANYFLIKLNGPVGAAQGVFVSYTFYSLFTWYCANRVIPLPWRKALTV
ncbi:MAG: oligosaccharide flippase family protein [Planctomycetes bacterium]|nr:oligosaccharide flippase family protein [Planctomycetota bacterium]